MTDVQILTIAIALATSFLAVFIGVFLNNNRLHDVRELLGTRMNDTKELLGTRINDVKDLLGAKIEKSHAELHLLMERNHSEVLLKLTDMDNRLSRIENERRIVQ